MNGSNFGRIPALLIWSNMWKKSSRILAKNIKLILYRHLEGVQQPADPVIIELIGLVYVGIQRRNLILGGPPGPIIERAWIRQSALDHQLRHQAVVEIGLLSHRTQPIDRLTQAQTTQKWGGED